MTVSASATVQQAGILGTNGGGEGCLKTRKHQQRDSWRIHAAVEEVAQEMNHEL